MQEIIAGYSNKVAGGILLKLDFAKAYDMLDLGFVLGALRARGFYPK